MKIAFGIWMALDGIDDTTLRNSSQFDIHNLTLHCLLDYGSRFGNKNGRSHARLD